MPLNRRLYTVSIPRPPRVALFFDIEAPAMFGGRWHPVLLNILEATSAAWGGNGWTLFPFNGRELSPVQWATLALYDPDYLAYYRFSLDDIGRHDPALMESRLAPTRDDLLRKGFTADVIDKYLERCQKDDFIPTWAPKDKPGQFFLEEFVLKVMSSLSPFHSHDGNRYQLPHVRLSSHTQPTGPIVSSIELGVSHFASLETIESHTGLGGDWACETVFASFAGRFSERQRSALRNGRVRAIEVPLEPSEGGAIADEIYRVGPGHSNKAYPSTLSCLGLKPYAWPYRDGASEGPDSPLLVVGDGLLDYCAFHNLSRVRHSVAWIPIATTPAYAAFVSSYTSGQQFECEPGIATIISETLDEQRTRDVLKQHLTSPIFVNMGGNLAGMFENFHSHRWLASNDIGARSRRRLRCADHTEATILQFSDGLSMNALRPSAPSVLEKLPNLRCSWICELVQPGYLPPPRACLTKLLIQQNDSEYQSPRSDHVRWGWDGECRRFPDALLRYPGELREEIAPILLYRPDDDELISALFSGFGVGTSPSDKGRYVRETLRLFGCLDAATKWFRDPEFRSLLDVFLRGKGVPRGAVKIAKDNRAVLPLGIIEGVLKTDVRERLTELISRGVLARGTVLTCDRCRRRAWYRPGDFNDGFKCDHCFHAQLLLPSSVANLGLEPMWTYRLNEMVAQCVVHNSHIALLGLGALQQLAKEGHGFHYSSELLLSEHNASDCEIDVVAVSQGELLIGECKVAGSDGYAVGLSNDEIDKYSALQVRLNARAVLFITNAEQWRDADKARIATRVRKPIFWGSTQIYEHRDLELSAVVDPANGP